MRIVDLSYLLTDDMIVWPDNQRPIYQWLRRGDSDFCNVTRFDMVVHTGTHVDSPLHFLMEGETVDRLALDCFWGKARLFRFREEPAGQEVSLEAVRASGFTFGDAKIFVMHTGIDSLAGQRDYNYKYPVPSHDLIDWLLEQGMIAYMTDATAVDTPEENAMSPRHKRIFRKGLPVVENLAHLGEIPENADFEIVAMPLRLAGREGSPCRAAARLP